MTAEVFDISGQKPRSRERLAIRFGMEYPGIMLSRLKVPNDTAAAITRGHPWVFRDRPYRLSVGELVELVDGQDRRVGWGIADNGPIAVRVLGRGVVPSFPFERVLDERIQACERARRRWIGTDTDAYRVCNGEGDGLPGLVIDRYGKLVVVRLYAAAWEHWLNAIIAAVQKLEGVETIYRRLGVARVDGSDGGVTLYGPEPADAVIVHEYGMRLLVRPRVGQKTGMFLDQREHRQLVRRWASGTVANLFGYNGGFSVAAALGGANRVITVDIAADAIADAKENFRLNGLDPNQHGFEVADVFEWSPGKMTFDLLVLDPPSLAHDRSSEVSARRAYHKLHVKIGPMVAREGQLATSSCTSRLSFDAWRQIVAEGLIQSGEWSWHWISAEPPDHPVALSHVEGRYLKFALLHRR